MLIELSKNQERKLLELVTAKTRAEVEADCEPSGYEGKYPPAEPGALTIADPSKGSFRNRKSKAGQSTSIALATISFEPRRHISSEPELSRPPMEATSVNVKLLLPPRQSRGNSLVA